MAVALGQAAGGGWLLQSNSAMAVFECVGDEQADQPDGQAS
jgi:hypothetical protein